MQNRSQHVFKRLKQPFPDIKPYSPFRLDYVAKPYADLLDSTAVILGLWLAIAVITRLSHGIYGKSTRTVALRELIDRLTTCNISSFVSIRKRPYFSPRVQFFSNITTRLLSFLFFVLLLGAEALALFSQTSKSLGLRDLRLRRPSLKKPSSSLEDYESPWQWTIPLLEMETSNIRAPPYLILDKQMEKISVEDYFDKKIMFSTADEGYFRLVYTLDDTSVIELRYSVRFRDEITNTSLLLNLTKCGFNMTESKLSSLTEILKKESPESSIEGHHENKTTSVIVFDNRMYAEVLDKALQRFDAMVTLSNEELTSADFIIKNGQKLSEGDERNLKRLKFGKVKRLSGVILWLMVAALGIINFVVELITWDMDDGINLMIAECLGTSLTGLPRFSEDIEFQIVEVESSDTFSTERHNQEASNQVTCEETLLLKLEPIKSKCPSIVIMPDKPNGRSIELDEILEYQSRPQTEPKKVELL